MSRPLSEKEIRLPSIGFRLADDPETSASGCVDLLLGGFGLRIAVCGGRLLTTTEARAVGFVGLEALQTFDDQAGGGTEPARATVTLDDGIELHAVATTGWLSLRAEIPGGGGESLTLYEGALGDEFVHAVSRAYSAACDIEKYALEKSCVTAAPTEADRRNIFSPVLSPFVM